MKILYMRNLGLIALICTFCYTSFGQVDTGVVIKYNSQTSVMQRIIDSLENKNIDSWSNFYYSCDYPSDDVQDFLVWQEGSVIKLLIYTFNQGEKERFLIKVLQKSDVTEYSSYNLDTLSTERIIPFTFKFDMEGYETYSQLGGMHSCFFHLTINNHGQLFHSTIPLTDIEENYVGLNNLNHKYNSSTQLYKLIKELQKLVVGY